MSRCGESTGVNGTATFVIADPCVLLSEVVVVGGLDPGSSEEVLAEGDADAFDFVAFSGFRCTCDTTSGMLPSVSRTRTEVEGRP